MAILTATPDHQHGKATAVVNPFDDKQQSFYALVNDEGQYSLWPAWALVPAGWTAACGPGDRDACLAHINQAWTDMRPQSLIAAMATAADGTD